MGVSTDGVLFYGYCWSDEDVELLPEQDDDREWSELVLERRGEVNPWSTYPAELDDPRSVVPYEKRRAAGDAWVAEHRQEIDAWRAKKAAVEQEFGVEVHSHCSGDCSMPYLSTFRIVASRGYPEAVGPLVIESGWSEKLDAFMAFFGIEKPQPQPGWWLVSYWG